MNKLTECPCCGYPHDDVEAKAMKLILNKIKADTVRDAMKNISNSLDWDWSHVSSYEYCELLNEHADKLERGDL